MYDDIVGGYPLVKGGIEAIPIRLEIQLIHAFIPEDNIMLMPLRKMHGRKEIVQRYPRVDRLRLRKSGKEKALNKQTCNELIFCDILRRRCEDDEGGTICSGRDEKQTYN